MTVVHLEKSTIERNVRIAHAFNARESWCVEEAALVKLSDEEVAYLQRMLSLSRNDHRILS